MSLSLRVINLNEYIAKKHLWIIELHNGQDSRLTHELINQGLKPALNTVEKEWRESWRIHMKDQTVNKDEGKGALVIVGRRDQDKFFSNGVSSSASETFPLIHCIFPGLDFPNSSKDPNFFPGNTSHRIAHVCDLTTTKETFDPLLERILTFPSKFIRCDIP